MTTFVWFRRVEKVFDCWFESFIRQMSHLCRNSTSQSSVEFTLCQTCYYILFTLTWHEAGSNIIFQYRQPKKTLRESKKSIIYDLWDCTPLLHILDFPFSPVRAYIFSYNIIWFHTTGRMYYIWSDFHFSSIFCRSSFSSSLQKHHSAFVNLLLHHNLEVSLKSLELLLSFNKTLPDKVSNVMKLCSNCVGFFYKLLHKLANEDGKISGKTNYLLFNFLINRSRNTPTQTLCMKSLNSTCMIKQIIPIVSLTLSRFFQADKKSRKCSSSPFWFLKMCFSSTFREWYKKIKLKSLEHSFVILFLFALVTPVHGPIQSNFFCCRTCFCMYFYKQEIICSLQG